jgi:hypothetical protein
LSRILEEKHDPVKILNGEGLSNKELHEHI